MIQTIRIGHLLREAVAAPYRNLVTRPTGAAVADPHRGGPGPLRLPHRVAGLLRHRAARPELRRRSRGQAAARRARDPPAFLVLRGLREDQHEAIDHVLTHHRLAVTATLTAPRSPGCWAGPAPTRGRRSTLIERDAARSAELAGALWAGRKRGPARRCRRWSRIAWSVPAGCATGRFARHEPPAVRPLHHGHPRRAAPPRRLDPDGAGAASRAAPSPIRSGREEEVLYTRYGNNPNQVELAAKYALLEGAEEAIFCASGMGATALAHLAVLRPGDHLI